MEIDQLAVRDRIQEGLSGFSHLPGPPPRPHPGGKLKPLNGALWRSGGKPMGPAEGQMEGGVGWGQAPGPVGSHVHVHEPQPSRMTNEPLGIIS